MIQSPEHDLAEWRSASDHRHKLHHSNSGREKFGSAYRQKKTSLRPKEGREGRKCYGYVHCMASQRDIGSRESEVHASLIM